MKAMTIVAVSIILAVIYIVGIKLEEEVLVEALDDAALGKHIERVSRTAASVRGRVAQGENYFMEQPNRDNQVTGRVFLYNYHQK